MNTQSVVQYYLACVQRAETIEGGYALFLAGRHKPCMLLIKTICRPEGQDYLAKTFGCGEAYLTSGEVENAMEALNG